MAQFARMGRGSRWDIVTCMLLHVGLFIVAGESPSSTTPRNLVLGTQNGLLVQARSHAASLRSSSSGSDSRTKSAAIRCLKTYYDGLMLTDLPPPT